MASEADMEQILQWNSKTWPASLTTVHGLVQQQARKTPTAPAICAWDGDLTYAELDNVSTQLALYIGGTYINVDRLIPVACDKSKWAVIAMLAVLKAGGAVVPVDPSNPVGRLQAIGAALRDHNALKNQGKKNWVMKNRGNDDYFSDDCLLADDKHIQNLEKALGRQGLPMTKDLLRELDYDHPVTDLPNIPPSQVGGAEPNDAAFIVFTSGSTGVPKGIVIEHAALCTSALAHGAVHHESLFAQGIQPRVLQFAAYTFDVSIGDMFTTLIHGGCICIPSEEQRMDDLVGVTNAMDVNHLHLTPTVAGWISPDDVPGVKVLVAGGEPLTQHVVDRWADRVELINSYGPAECSICSVIRPGIKVGDTPNNIGRGVGATIWLVDPEDHNRLVPVGHEGEMLIEGPILGRGYLNSPKLTAKAFIEDPDWARQAGKTRRFYKTGDLARYNPDGTIGILGRNDDQVKLRGQRMELGEVEWQLKQFAQTDVAAAIVQIGGGHKELAAYIVVGGGGGNAAAQSGQSLMVHEEGELNAFRTLTRAVEAELRKNLPGFMVPSAYIPVRRIPLSASAKVDRKTLIQLATGLSRSQLVQSLGAPEKRAKGPIRRASTSTEAVLHGLWRSLFPEVHDIGIDDNFFGVGGDSMTAMRLVSLARKAHLILTVDLIFKHPVLHELASQAKKDSEATQYPSNVAPFSLLPDSLDVATLRAHAVEQCRVQPHQVLDIYPVTSLQEADIRGAYLGGKDDSVRDGKTPRDEQETMVFEIPSSTDLNQLVFAWREVVLGNDILRTRMIETEAGVFQVVLDDRLQVEYSALPIEEFVAADRLNAMVFGSPLIRLAIVCPTSKPAERFLVLTMAHAIYDGFSQTFLFDCLVAQSKPAALNFWTNELLTDVEALTPRPVAAYDRTQRRILRKTRRTVNFLIPARTSGQDGTITLSTMIQVSAAMAVSYRTGGGDVVFATLLSGRMAGPGFMDLFGPTLTSMPLRIRLKSANKTNKADGTSVRDVLHATQTLVHGDLVRFPHVGWSDLVQRVDPAESGKSFVDVLRSAPQLNVNPNPSHKHGAELGLRPRAVGPQNDNEVYFAMSSMAISDALMYLMISSDDAHVPGEDAEAYLAAWAAFLGRIEEICREGKDDVTVEEMLAWWKGQGGK